MKAVNKTIAEVANEQQNGWKLVAIQDIAEINPKLDKSAIPDNLMISFVPMQAVGAGDGTIDVSNLRPASEVKKGFTNFQEGDVLFAKITPCMENGKMAVVPKVASGYGFGSTEFHVLRPKDGVDPRYLYYFVSSQSVRKEASHNMTGAVGQKRVSTSYITDLEIPLAPPDQQRLIVAEIEKQSSRLDEAVVNLKRVKANLKRYKAAVLKAAVEGRLVETEAELARREGRSYETGTQLLQLILETRRSQWKGRGKYKEPIAPDTTDLPSLPKGWVTASIEQVVENYDGVRVPVRSKDREQRQGPYPYYGASGVIDHVDSYLFDGDHLLIAEDGANLLSRSTPIAFQASGKFWVNNHAHIVQTQGGIPLAFLEHYLNGKDLALFVTGTAQPKLTQAAMNKILVPLPPLAEQHRIDAEIDRRLSLVREVEAQVDANLLRAERMRQSVLQGAFNGKLIKRARGNPIEPVGHALA